jgi:hypothetical protein
MSKYDKKHGQIERTLTAIVTAAATNLTTDTPGNVVQLQVKNGNALTGYSVPDGGGLFNRLKAIPRASVAADTVLYLFVSQDGGATFRQAAVALLKSQVLTVSVAPTPAVFSDLTTDDPIRSQFGDTWYVAASNALAGGISFLGNLTEFGTVEE